MGDKGIVALASIINQDCFEQLKFLSLSANIATSDRGIIALARAVETRGLPMLEGFVMDMRNSNDMTIEGISAIAFATIKSCPKLKQMRLLHSRPNKQTVKLVVKGMLEAVGRAGQAYGLILRVGLRSAYAREGPAAHSTWRGA